MSSVVPSPRTRALALVTGAALSACGHLMHPVDHTAASRAVGRFQFAHLLFVVGSMLLLGGLPVVRRRLGGDAVAAVLVGCFSASTMLIAPLVSIELFASKHVDQATFDKISDESAALGAVAMITMVAGAVGIGVLLWRRAISRPIGAVLVASGLMLLLVPGLPGEEGYWVIASLGAMNLALAVLGLTMVGHQAWNMATVAAPRSNATTMAS